MSKKQSFLFSLAVTIIATTVVEVLAAAFKIELSGDRVVAFLIYWYMLWKLFHDKNKD